MAISLTDAEIDELVGAFRKALDEIRAEKCSSSAALEWVNKGCCPLCGHGLLRYDSDHFNGHETHFACPDCNIRAIIPDYAMFSAVPGEIDKNLRSILMAMGGFLASEKDFWRGMGVRFE